MMPTSEADSSATRAIVVERDEDAQINDHEDTSRITESMLEVKCSRTTALLFMRCIKSAALRS